jgi:long-subunit acyl-CoA synthetase (AMP-forming)
VRIADDGEVLMRGSHIFAGYHRERQEPLAGDDRERAPGEALVDGVDVFANIEQVKRFTILPRDISQDDGEPTPALKVKRGVICSRYRDAIDRTYARREP